MSPQPQQVWEIGKPLADGYLRIILTDAPERRVNVLASWTWTSPELLRAAARDLNAAAEWLDTPTPPIDDSQLILEGFTTEQHSG